MVTLKNLQFLLLGGVIQVNLEQKPVQLRLGQGIGALKIHRILRGKDRKPCRQWAAHAVAGHLAFFHAFEQGGLGAGGHAVDLVHQQEVGEHRAGMKAEGFRARTEDGGAENVGRHEVGGGLHALEAEAEQPSKSLHDQRLGDARHAFKQRMALAQDGDQHLFDRLFLAGNHPPQLLAGVGNQMVGGAERLRGCGVLVCILIWFLNWFLTHEALSCCVE